MLQMAAAQVTNNVLMNLTKCYYEQQHEQHSNKQQQVKATMQQKKTTPSDAVKTLTPAEIMQKRASDMLAKSKSLKALNNGNIFVHYFN